MPTQIVALGGSLLRPEEADERTMWFGQLRQMAVHFEGNGRKLGIVVGGGLPAREGITLARESFSDAYRLDTVGIAATRLNATILQQMGMDPNYLSYFHSGLDEKLVGVEGAEPIHEIIA